MVSILAAQAVNIAMNGAVVGPGDLDDLQDEFIDACRIIAQEVPRLRAKIPKPDKKGKK